MFNPTVRNVLHNSKQFLALTYLLNVNIAIPENCVDFKVMMYVTVHNVYDFCFNFYDFLVPNCFAIHSVIHVFT